MRPEANLAGARVDNEEYDEGLRCVGAPIVDHSGRVVAAIGIGGPVTRVTPERIELLRSPGNPAIQVASALDGVRRAPTILEAMRTLGEVIPAVDAALAEGVDDVVLELIHEAVADDSDTVAGLVAAFGSGAMTNSVPEFGTDTECFLITGSNTTEAHPLVASHVLAGKERGAKIVVVDPRRIQARIVDGANGRLDLGIPIRSGPGSGGSALDQPGPDTRGAATRR